VAAIQLLWSFIVCYEILQVSAERQSFQWNRRAAKLSFAVRNFLTLEEKRSSFEDQSFAGNLENYFMEVP
jgi:hypothetical protein